MDQRRFALTLAERAGWTLGDALAAPDTNIAVNNGEPVVHECARWLNNGLIFSA
jgi:hypothetical protein